MLYQDELKHSRYAGASPTPVVDVHLNGMLFHTVALIHDSTWARRPEAIRSLSFTSAKPSTPALKAMHCGGIL
jgi:hypothetical protein